MHLSHTVGDVRPNHKFVSESICLSTELEKSDLRALVQFTTGLGDSSQQKLTVKIDEKSNLLLQAIFP